MTCIICITRWDLFQPCTSERWRIHCSARQSKQIKVIVLADSLSGRNKASRNDLFIQLQQLNLLFVQHLGINNYNKDGCIPKGLNEFTMEGDYQYFYTTSCCDGCSKCLVKDDISTCEYWTEGDFYNK